MMGTIIVLIVPIIRTTIPAALLSTSKYDVVVIHSLAS
jgi:hypothetical protein